MIHLFSELPSTECKRKKNIKIRSAVLEEYGYKHDKVNIIKVMVIFLRGNYTKCQKRKVYL